MATQDNETRLVLERLEKEIATIKSLLEQIIASQQELIDKSKGAYPPSSYGQADGEGVVEDGLDVGILLRLPDHLRKTMLALAKLIEGRADEVAQITGRARAIESGYLNQLMRLGYVRKIRRKHQIYFALSEGD
mgnify:CR=1 FL=1|uniref:Transcriptional regulator n=1 Tax=Candidatus Methanomethylicus mesodigestus TaxID=1867258 RepID=A0A7C3J4C5_9CREN